MRDFSEVILNDYDRANLPFDVNSEKEELVLNFMKEKDLASGLYALLSHTEEFESGYFQYFYHKICGGSKVISFEVVFKYINKEYIFNIR
jgi:hypothetical protein